MIVDHSRRSVIGLQHSGARCGVAAVELALVMPLLLLLSVISVDFARGYYNAQVISDSARSAALFAANTDLSDMTSLNSATEMALKCAQGLKPLPTVTITTGVDSDDRDYVEVTVSQQFPLVSPFIFNSHYPIQRTSRARLFPSAIASNPE